MTSNLTPIERCAEIAGLRGHEIVLGVSPGDKHERMLARYRRTVSGDAARTRLVADIRDAVQIGAERRAADLLIVLRRLLAEGFGSDVSKAKPSPWRRRGSTRLRLGPTARNAAPTAAGGSTTSGAKVLPWRRKRESPLSESVV